MKILFAGYRNPSFWAVSDYIEMALGQMGHHVEFFDYRRFLLPGRLRDRLPALHRWDLRRLNASLESSISAFKPRLFLVAGGYTVDPRPVLMARRSGAVTAAWYLIIPIYSSAIWSLPSFDIFYKRHGRTGTPPCCQTLGRFCPSPAFRICMAGHARPGSAR